MARILIVEDDVDLADQQRELLELEGHAVLTANSIGEGRELFIHNMSIELVVIDIKFDDTPDMNGIDLYKSVKDIRCNVKFLFWSGTEEEENLAVLTSFPGVSFLKKGIDTVEFLKIIEELTGE